MRRLALPLAPDTAERHRVAAQLCGDAGRVLDVGGTRGLLGRFLPGASVATANLDGSADVRYPGGALPFADDSFEVVTSLDVLEHVEPKHRAFHIEELLRVARDRVVCCTPLGTPEHVAAERELAERLRASGGEAHPFLLEHLSLGLPTEAELRALPGASLDGFELSFQGDFRRSIAWADGAARLRRGSVAALPGLVGRLRSPASLDLSRSAGRWTNRAFLVWRLRDGAGL